VKYEHLLHRPFLLGVRDCFALARAFFKDNFDIELTNVARPKDWDPNTLDLLRIFHEDEGFEMIVDWKIKDIRPADVFCMNVGSTNPSHIAIYVGDGNMIHHLVNRPSSMDPFRDFWRSSTAFILRHKDVPDLTVVYPDVTIEELLNARHTTTVA
jgi:cell wall-associated NlpC family hydrolase